MKTPENAKSPSLKIISGAPPSQPWRWREKGKTANLMCGVDRRKKRNAIKQKVEGRAQQKEKGRLRVSTFRGKRRGWGKEKAHQLGQNKKNLVPRRKKDIPRRKAYPLAVWKRKKKASVTLRRRERITDSIKADAARGGGRSEPVYEQRRGAREGARHRP